MSWRDKDRQWEWAGQHPVRYGLLLAVVLALFHLLMRVWFGPASSWVSLVLWVAVFPILSASIARARYKSSR